MKRFISILIAVTAIMSTMLFSSCSKNENLPETTSPASFSTETEESPTQENAEYAVLTLNSDNDSPKPGEKFTVTVKVENGEMFCNMDLYLKFDPKVIEYVEFNDPRIADLHYDINNSEKGTLYYAAFVLTTQNITTDNFAAFTFKVLDSAEKGADCGIECTQECMYQIGLDERGDKIKNVTGEVEFNGCRMTVG